MASFTTSIQNWFKKSARNLPWRETNDAYKIWLSEVVLQQTRVDQGMAYYQRFIKVFPTVKDLANADEDQVLNLWQGLGYYSRARNMHFSAKLIVEKYDGVFPKTYKEVLGLKGVGEYTAAAITSIAYGLPHAVVDGNVYRVLSRYLAIDTPIDSAKGKRVFKEVAQELLDKKNPGNHNQALMEIGALVCLPKNPDCAHCPLTDSCLAKSKNEQLNFPIKEKKVKVVDRYFHYLVFTNGDSTLLKKREGKGIWQGLYDFPLIEKKQEGDIESSEIEIPHIVELKPDGKFKHILSHQRIYASFWIVQVSKLEAVDNQVLVPLSDVEDYPLPQLLIRYIKASSLFGAD